MTDLNTKNIRPEGSTRLVLACALAGLATLVFAWFAGFVAAGGTDSIDACVRNFFYSFSSPALTWIVLGISYLGKLKFLVGLGAIVVGMLAYLRKFRALTLFLVTMAGEILLEVSLKATYRRARPEPFFDLPFPESFSFPSGHALGALCFYGIVAWIIIDNLESKAWQIITALVAGALILAIGLSRIYLGMHYPSDVVGGFLAGIIWTSAVIYTFRRLRYVARPI